MKKTLIILVVLFIAIQLIPVKRENPPVVADFDGPAEVKDIFKVSCYDCHSNETRWVWYTNIAPVKWLAAHDVKEGREHLNFSNWGNIPSEKYGRIAYKIWDDIEEGEMPLKIHTIMHKDAILSDEQKAIVKDWAQSLNN